MAQLPPEAYQLLNYIARPESGGRYNVLYGGGTFGDYAAHPGIYNTISSGPNAGKKSSAAGRYQFLERTWNDIASRYGIPDFSPQSQDAGAWYLANEAYKNKTGGDLLEAMKAGNYDQVAKALSGTWTSLAGGIEAQPGGKASMLASAPGAAPMAPAAAPTAPAGLAAPAQAAAAPTGLAEAQPNEAAMQQAQQILAGLMGGGHEQQQDEPIRPRGLAADASPYRGISFARVKARRRA